MIRIPLRRFAARALSLALAAAAVPAAAQVLVPPGPAQPAQPTRPASPSKPPTISGTIENPAIPWRTEPPPSPDQLIAMPAVLHLPGESAIEVRRDIAYRTVNGQVLRFDLYLPPGATRALPAVIFVSGASDSRDWAVFKSYGRMAATQGLAAIVYAKRYRRNEVLEGADDTAVLLDFLRSRGAELGIDATRVAMWGFSAGGRLLATGMNPRHGEVRAIVGFYSLLDMSADLPFYPDSLRPLVRDRASPVSVIQDRPASVPPTLLVRAGLDDPAVNAGIERFARFAYDSNRPVELINYPEGRHGFDLLDDREESRRIMRRAFRFVIDALGSELP